MVSRARRISLRRPTRHSTWRSETARTVLRSSRTPPRPPLRTSSCRSGTPGRACQNSAVRVSAKVDYALRACAELVQSQRGAEGGYWLSQPPEEIALAAVIRAVEGPIANVRGERPELVDYSGPAAPLQQVWIAVRANLRAVLEEVTVADLAAGRLPDEVAAIAADPDAWLPH